MTTTRWSALQAPVGALQLAADDDGLVDVNFVEDPAARAAAKGWMRDDDSLAEARAQLAAYFARERTRFDLPLAAKGTPFQRAVWAALVAIPYGTTTTYGAIARQLGGCTSARAVGTANGANPIAIIVPCHRVIGASGSLTGYAGGLHRKEALLTLEGALLA